MNEIVRVFLENEMDLILAHRQSMRLAELTGFSLSAQTSFATAVSEVCRTVIDQPKDCFLMLGIDGRRNYIVAKVTDGRINRTDEKNEGYLYAKKLAEKIELKDNGVSTEIELRAKPPLKRLINTALIEKWKFALNIEPAVSPYEEIKRKNRMLLELADNLKQSEQSYVTLTDSLPLIIFTMDTKGNVIYANKWLLDYSGESVESLSKNKWAHVIHPEEYKEGWAEWHKQMSSHTPRKVERRLYHAGTGAYKWHTGVTIPIKDDAGNVQKLNTFLMDIDAEKKMQQALKDNKELLDIKLELERKITELDESNRELEQFAYIASHDLQEPLRKINYYSDYLEKKFGHAITAEGNVFLTNIINAGDRMRQLIHDVLAYSTINNNELFSAIDLNVVLKEAVHDLEIAIKEKHTVINIGELPVIEGNFSQLKQLFENLLSNSLKFTAPETAPVIDVQSKTEHGYVIIEFKDNGIGFDEKYIDKMFNLFQRLHTRDKFAGTGIGLGICKKIVAVHKGEISAKSTLGEGAVFIIKLPVQQSHQN